MNSAFLSKWPRAVRRRVVWQCGVAVLAVVATTVCAHVIDHELARRYLFLTYYPSLLISAFLGGLVSGLVALAGTEAVIWGYWLAREPGNYQFSMRGLAPLAVSAGTGILLSLVMEQFHRTLERLEAALERERRDSATKDTFLASLSHELRTPINVVLGRAQMLRMLFPDERWREGLDAIARNARAQSKLIEQLLDSQRIVHEHVALNPGVVQLDDLARAVVSDLKLATEQGSVRFAAHLEPVALWGDGDRLRQVVHNLLGNAIKFTPPSGAITLRVRREGATAVIEVEDTGIGFAPEFVPYLFERFRQADPSHTHAAQRGLGLGLAIVKAIVDAHGGQVSAASEGLGRGACFVVRLPIGALAVEPRFQGESAHPMASAARRAPTL